MCKEKNFAGGGVPGLPRENNAVARYQEFFFYPGRGGFVCSLMGSLSCG